MATKKEVDDHLKIALKEVGDIKPKFDKKINAWIFSHRLYPVEYAGNSPEEVIKNYPKYLREFIKHRLDNKLAPVMEKMTKGHGGKRQGAGRPTGSKKNPTTTIRIAIPVAKWIKDHKKDLQDLLSGEKVLTAKKQSISASKKTKRS